MSRYDTVRRRALSMFGALMLSSLPLAAAETSLTAPGAPDSLVNRLKAGSFALSAQEREVEDTQEILAAALADYRTLVSLLYDQGYFGPVVSIKVDGREAATIPPLSPPAKIDRIDITVDTGPVYTFGAAGIAPLAPDTLLPEDYASGKRASTRAIQNAARAGVQRWQEIGHAKADLGAQSITANHPKAQLDASLTLTPGPKLYFGKATVAGDSGVREEAILRIAGFPSGTVYDPAEVQKVGDRLRRTGAFGAVSLQEAETANPDGTLDFTINATGRKPRRVRFGAEVATETGLEISAGWMHRNIFGGGERLAFDARVRNIGGPEEIDGLIALRLDRPAAFGADYDQFYLGELEILDEPFYRLSRALVATGVKRIYSDDLFAELSIGIQASRSTDAFGDRKFNMVLMRGRVEWDKRNSEVNPTNGFFVDASAIPYAGFDDTETGGRLTLDTRGYLPLLQERVVLAGRVQVGSVVGSSLAGTPPNFTFFSGGAGTVRGQPYQSLGLPFNDSTVGGRGFLGLAGEIRTRVTDSIGVVAFVDYGAVDAESFVGANAESHAGAGLGIRYDLGGVGPLRFDLGWPISGDTGDGLQFYLGIGQAF
ncbi:MAG: BamA/TamA family outer membrane protein [Marinibacterium sp.]|nr:BamA/TamA family outer membrane protein [Marinibacterium sp.]